MSADARSPRIASKHPVSEDAEHGATAFQWAMKCLNRRQLSGAELATKLRGKGFDEASIESAMAKLLRTGALDDAALGRAVIDETQRAKPAGEALLRAKLLKRGLNESVVERLLDDVSRQGNDPVDAAVMLAKKKLATMTSADAAAQKRRLWGLLTRRGFDADTIESAIARLGID